MFKQTILLLFCMLLTSCTLAVEYPLTAASIGVWGATGKSPTDHALSFATGKDCKTTRIFENEKTCIDNTAQLNTDKAGESRSVELMEKTLDNRVKQNQ